MDWLWKVGLETYKVFSMAAPFLLLGFALAGAAHVLLPTERARQWLGRRGWRGVTRASLLGLPLPLCSCSVIPVAAALRKQGAGKGATASFLISTPQTGVDSIALTYALLDPVTTIFRPLASLVSALVGGMAVDLIDPDTDTHDDGTVHIGEECSHCAAHEPEEAAGCHGQPARAPWYARWLSFGFVEVARDTVWPLLIGLLLSGAMKAMLPEDFFQRYLGNEFVAVVLMLLVGLPLYVCASASTFLAAAMIDKGLSPGAAMVFLLAGPATNITTMLVVRQQLGWRSLWVYLGSVAVMAVLMGLALNAVYGFLDLTPVALNAEDEGMLPPWATTASAAALGGVLLAAAVARLRARFRSEPAACCHDEA